MFLVHASVHAFVHKVHTTRDVSGATRSPGFLAQPALSEQSESNGLRNDRRLPLILLESDV
jgi:hypothetical protein